MYITSILQKYGMENANAVSTPLDPNLTLVPNKEDREPNCSNDYASLIGSLQYLAIATCPDMYSLCYEQAGYLHRESEFRALYGCKMHVEIH